MAEYFEQPEREPVIPLEKAKEYAADTTKAASVIKVLKGSEGWQIFLAMLAQRKQETREKDDYPTIEAFRSDRNAIKIVESIIDEMDNIETDAEAAADLFTKLSGADGQTPRNTVDLSSGAGES